LNAYKEASKLAEDKQGWILANIGNILKNQGFYAESIKYLQRALELESESQYAHKRLAEAQQLEEDETKKLESLLADAQKALTRKGEASAPAAT
jgi:tetratricopeptide (TPR) repeat protein